MSLSVGIVGLPNVGKSTLFNALLSRQQALAANYPFATIEPNVGVVQVRDDRLVKLAEVIKASESLEYLPPIVHPTIEFVDIAGIVEGASKGEGLGNQFLANIREVDLICHVLRDFEDEEIVLTGNLDPVSDLQTVRTELILKDLETMQKQEKGLRKADKKLADAFQQIYNALNSGQKPSLVSQDVEIVNWFKGLHLLSVKPEIFAINTSENKLKVNDLASLYAQKFEILASDVVAICAKVEAELAELGEEDRRLYLKDLGVRESGIEKMARCAYSKLNLISFLTAGVKEVRAWTIKSGSNALQASGVIHTDFMKHFIKADVCSIEDFVGNNGWKAARENGKVRSEGRDYLMKDGDVVEFKIGA